jgi:hypothetical protein
MKTKPIKIKTHPSVAFHSLGQHTKSGFHSLQQPSLVLQPTVTCSNPFQPIEGENVFLTETSPSQNQKPVPLCGFPNQNSEIHEVNPLIPTYSHIFPPLFFSNTSAALFFSCFGQSNFKNQNSKIRMQYTTTRKSLSGINMH